MRPHPTDRDNIAHIRAIGRFLDRQFTNDRIACLILLVIAASVTTSILLGP